MAALRQGARLLKPAACFGTGYLYCWTQGREETAPQLLACSGMASWAGLARGLRHLRHALPEGAEWPREKLAKAESLELRVMAQAANSCESQDLSSTLLRRVLLRRLCNYAMEEGRNSLGVQGLVSVPETVEGEGEANASSASRGSGLSELVAFLDASTLAVASGGAGPEQELLQPVASALSAVVGEGDSAWHKELDPVGVLHVTQTALVASAWLAESLRTSSAARRQADASGVSATMGLSAEEHDEIAKELTTVWQALSQAGAAPAARSAAKGFRSRPEAAQLLRDVNARFATLQATPPLPPKSTPAQDDLPSQLAGRLRAAMSGAASAPKKEKKAIAPSVVEVEVVKPSGVLSKTGKLLEYAAWVVIIGGVAVVVSADGLGLASFHVVPEDLRPSWQAFLQQKAIRVEELCANHDPSPESGSGLPSGEAITLGPWGVQSTYIQGTSDR